MIFAIVGAIAVGYSGARYAQLTDKITVSTYDVRLDLADSGGIFPGAEVSYRGVPIGRVGQVVPAGDGIRADLVIRKEWRVPADTRAEVHNRSAVGEQYVDLVPAHENGPYLRDGSTIPRDHTSTPLPEQELLASLDRFVGSVNTADLATVVGELGTGFEGNGDAIGRLLDGSTALVNAARTNLPATVSLLDHTAIVLRTQEQQTSSIRSFSHSLAQLTDTFRTHDQQVRTLIRDGSGLAVELSATLRGFEPDFDVLTQNLAVLGGIAGRGVRSLEQILVAFPYNVSTAPQGARNGQAQFTLQLAQSPEACQKGYVPPQLWRSTQEIWPVAPNYDVGCADPKLNQRGSAHVP